MTPSERAAFEAGARAMREECGKIADSVAAKWSAFHSVAPAAAKEVAGAIRALPLPAPASEAAEPKKPEPDYSREGRCPACGEYVEDVSACGCPESRQVRPEPLCPHGRKITCPECLADTVVEREQWETNSEPTPAESQPKEKHERRSAKSTYCRCGYPWIVDRCASPDAERAEDLAGHKEPIDARDRNRP